MNRLHAWPLAAALVLAACGPQSDTASTDSAAPAAATPAPRASNAPRATGNDVEWPMYRGNLAAQNYSPLALLDRDNVADLRVAWRWYAGNFGPRPEQRMESTPIMVDGVLYTTAGITRNVVAIEPTTGQTLWIYRPDDGEERFEAAPRKTSGRGLARWVGPDGEDRLILVTPGFNLVALDPDTGRPVPGFGENGVVDLMVGVRGEINDKASIGNSSPATVVGDTIVVGPRTTSRCGRRPRPT